MKERSTDMPTSASVFLQSERIYLRPLLPEDAPFLLRWNNDEATRLKTGETRPTSPRQAEEFIGKEKDDRVWFGIVLKEGDVLIGETGLLRMFPDWRTTDLSIIIPEEKHQGKGYGTEAIHLMLSYAFGSLNFNRIAIGVVGFNEKAIRFYEKVGFKREGIQEEGYYCNFEYSDFIMMRILKREYMALRGISERRLEGF
jgi:diamine N-acetyltransferase